MSWALRVPEVTTSFSAGLPTRWAHVVNSLITWIKSWCTAEVWKLQVQCKLLSNLQILHRLEAFVIAPPWAWPKGAPSSEAVGLWLAGAPLPFIALGDPISRLGGAAVMDKALWRGSSVIRGDKGPKLPFL